MKYRTKPFEIEVFEAKYEPLPQVAYVEGNATYYDDGSMEFKNLGIVDE